MTDTTPMITKAAAAALLVVPGSAWAGPQPTATEIFNLQERCAVIRRAIQEGYDEEMAKQKPIDGVEIINLYTSNYNSSTNRCDILRQNTTRVYHRDFDGKLLSDKPPTEYTSWYLRDYQTSKEPIAYCLTGENAGEYGFTPAGNVTAKEACAFIDKMMQTHE